MARRTQDRVSCGLRPAGESCRILRHESPPLTSATPPDPAFLALQEALAGRFSIERELGRGGMGIVYLAVDVALDRPVALKLLPPEHAARAELRERFVREARTAARLSHPHIVPIHAVEEAGDLVFFVMSWVEGETLGERVRTRGPLPPAEAARILREISWALAYAHGQGVVHRDVKPDNILLEERTGRALVTDFGIARAASSTGLTGLNELVGTPEFMSPEQAAGEEADGRSDLYALGVVGHYVLSGRVPIERASVQATLAAQLTQPAPPLATVAPDAPAPLREAIDRCLAKDPAERFADGEALAAALERALERRRETPSAIRAFQEQNTESTGAVAVVYMLLLMVATIVFVVATGSGEPWSDVLPGIVMTLLLSTLPAAMLGVMARRLLKAGYSHDEMVRALERDVEDRRRELASQAGEDTALDVWAPRVGWAGTLSGILGMVAILFPWVPVPVIEALVFTGMPLSLGGFGVTAIRGSLRKAVPGSRWLAFWDSPLGRSVFAVAGLGLARGAPAGGSYHPTEVAIGLAAGRIFEELPKDVRRSLGDVPAVVRKIEAHAESVRARVRELDRMLAEVDGPDGAAAVGSVAEDLRLAREAAGERLREVVAALERIRLELLRLHAGAGSVDGITRDLAAARCLSDDVDRLAEGHREVRKVLGERVPQEPDLVTPV